LNLTFDVPSEPNRNIRDAEKPDVARLAIGIANAQAKIAR
jgi:hypothetical protein